MTESRPFARVERRFPNEQSKLETLVQAARAQENHQDGVAGSAGILVWSKVSVKVRMGSLRCVAAGPNTAHESIPPLT